MLYFDPFLEWHRLRKNKLISILETISIRFQRHFATLFIIFLSNFLRIIELFTNFFKNGKKRIRYSKIRKQHGGQILMKRRFKTDFERGPPDPENEGYMKRKWILMKVVCRFLTHLAPPLLTVESFDSLRMFRFLSPFL